MREQIDGRFLQRSAVFILRNWTVLELATMAASVGILVHYLVENQRLQQRLRQDPGEIPYAIAEILKIRAPLLINRRRCLESTELRGRPVQRGDQITIMWASANRDELVFPDATQFRHERDQSQNLLWGAGIHICPGAPLARMQLRLALEALLGGASRWSSASGHSPVPATFPAAGWLGLPVALEPIHPSCSD
jgi:cytochrome P450